MAAARCLIARIAPFLSLRFEEALGPYQRKRKNRD
jgi:hypothetical protein